MWGRQCKLPPLSFARPTVKNLGFSFLRGLSVSIGRHSDLSAKPEGQTMRFIRKLRRDKKGATAIEYGLIAALIAVTAITAMQGLGSQLKSTFNKTSSAMVPPAS
jgi:pilus assembly protein Flp/PilA